MKRSSEVAKHLSTPSWNQLFFNLLMNPVRAQFPNNRLAIIVRPGKLYQVLPEANLDLETFLFEELMKEAKGKSSLFGQNVSFVASNLVSIRLGPIQIDVTLSSNPFESKRLHVVGALFYLFPFEANAS